ncbi:MAG: DedA family protein [bacterium]|nr:DedA family protein [bacterium]
MIDHFVSGIFHFLKSLSIYGAFLSMFVENVGIPLPTEIGYLIGQDLINRGLFSYGIILFVLTLGHVLGAVVSFGIGRLGDNYLNTKLKSNQKIARVHEKLERWYKKNGNLTVFLTRFIGYVRPWSSFVAGLAEVKFWPFLLWTTVGSLLFNIITLYFTSIFLAVWRRYAVYHFLIAIVVFLLVFGVIFYEIWKYLSRRRNKSD